MRTVNQYAKTGSGIWRDYSYDLDNPLDVARYIYRNPYSWPGGYELLAGTTDGGILCSGCVRSEYHLIYDSTKNGIDDGCRVIDVMPASDIEDSTLCGHCGKELCPYLDD